MAERSSALKRAADSRGAVASPTVSSLSLVFLLVFLPALLSLGWLLSGCGAATATDPGNTSSESGTAPRFSGVTLDGTIVTLDQYRGKPLFLVYMTST